MQATGSEGTLPDLCGLRAAEALTTLLGYRELSGPSRRSPKSVANDALPQATEKAVDCRTAAVEPARPLSQGANGQKNPFSGRAD